MHPPAVYLNLVISHPTTLFLPSIPSSSQFTQTSPSISPHAELDVSLSITARSYKDDASAAVYGAYIVMEDMIPL